MFKIRKHSGILAALLAGCSMLTACGEDKNVYAIDMAQAKAKISSTQAQYTSGSQTRVMRPGGVDAGWRSCDPAKRRRLCVFVCGPV